MIQTEVVLDRSPEAWLSLEFLAWWVRDWGRSGHEIQMRPMALPPKAYEIQLGRTLKFFIEYFVIEDSDSYEKTLAVAGEMGESIAENFAMYRECFENPAEFTGDVEKHLNKLANNRMHESLREIVERRAGENPA